MNTEEEKKEDVIGYEEARIEKDGETNPKAVPDEDVEVNTDRINPDENSMDSRG